MLVCWKGLANDQSQLLRGGLLKRACQWPIPGVAWWFAEKGLPMTNPSCYVVVCWKGLPNDQSQLLRGGLLKRACQWPIPAVTWWFAEKGFPMTNPSCCVVVCWKGLANDQSQLLHGGSETMIERVNTWYWLYLAGVSVLTLENRLELSRAFHCPNGS